MPASSELDVPGSPAFICLPHPTLPKEKKHAPGSPAYLHAATSGAGEAIHRWLCQIKRGPTYLFAVAGVECALEFCTGHWAGVAPYGMAEGGRWRWGRLESGDPDEDESGEDILLDAALGRPPVRGRAGRRHRAEFPAYPGGDLTQAEIKAHAATRAEQNLQKLVLHEVP